MAELPERLRTGVKRLAMRAGPRRRGSKHRQVWESKWASQAFDPIWRMHEIPNEMRAAVDTGWFDPVGRVIDIGCGDGTLAAWLAWRGFDTLGVDFAPSAIRQARAHHLPGGRLGELDFALIDICAPSLDLGTFQTLVDRGCFHGIHAADRTRYARNVSALAEPGARFLMMSRVIHVPKNQRLRQIRRALASSFSINRVEDIIMGEGRHGESRPGVAVYMTRLE